FPLMSSRPLSSTPLPYTTLFRSIAIPGGWKTYWRSPGDAGGVPPEFDWQGSENLAAARVKYPAPHRLHDDKAGDAVGYKDGVIRSEEHTSELQSRVDLVCRLLLE